MKSFEKFCVIPLLKIVRLISYCIGSSLYKNIIIIIIRLKNIYIHQQIHYYGISYKQQQLIPVIFEAISGY